MPDTLTKSSMLVAEDAPTGFRGSKVDMMSKWLSVVDRELNRLSSLEFGWDGGKAKPINAAILKSVRELLQKSMKDDSPAPSIIGEPDGNVCLEWKLTEGVSLVIDFESNDSAWVEYNNSSSPIPGEWDAFKDLGRLSRAIEEIARKLKK